MAKYSKGDSVIFVETNEVGVIVEVYEPYRGKQQYAVRWIKSGATTDVLENRLEPERKLDNAFDMLKAGVVNPYVNFFRLNTQHKIENTSVNTISSLKASRTIFKAYQYKPLLKFLNSDNRRLLIADEVGLGKTIEAGHIMLELKARDELNSALIICPSSLKAKWHDELETRFDFRFKVYQHKSDFVEDVANRRPIFGILTYESARESVKNDIGDTLEEYDIQLDLLVCDEAHRMRNDETATFAGGQKIIASSKSVVFMTATPIMLNESNLFHLMNLLDPDRFKSEYIFNGLLNANKPFVAAISELNAKVPFSTIADNLENSEIRYEFKSSGEDEYSYVPVRVSDEYKDNPLFKKIIDDLRSAPETDASRVRIQYDISSISLLNNIFSRTTKRDVTTDWTQAIRQPETKTVELTEFEQQLYDDYVEDYCVSKGYCPDGSDMPGFELSSLRKKLSSSIIAYATKWEGATQFPHDSKYEELKNILQKVVRTEKKKIIIFATQIPTLHYLQHRLNLDGYGNRLIYGDVKDRYAVIKEFRHANNIDVLLSSEVGGEGLDMQFCDSMVNYDLPWNPMVVEQRIGRIDRFGQKSKFVYIYNILVKGTLQEQIYGRLLDRIGIFRECIGDIEVILDLYLEKNNIRGMDFMQYLESEIDRADITEEEVARKLDSMQKALEQQKQDVEKLTKGLTESLTNDMYFKEEINRIAGRGRYITEKELINFVQSVIDCELTTCRLKKVNNDVYNIILQKGDSNALSSFLTQYKPAKTDSSYTQFQNLVREELTIPVTFNQEYAFENRDWEYINSYHPLVMAIAEYYRQKGKNDVNTFKLGLERDVLGKDSSISTGKYVLGVYQLEMQREIFRTIKKSQILVPIVFDCQKEVFLEDSDACEELFAKVQEKAVLFNEPIVLKENFPLQMAFNEWVSDVQDNYKSDYSIRAESNKMILRQRTQSQYESRIRDIERRIFEYEYSEDAKKQKILPALKGQLKKAKEEMELELNSIDNNKVTANPYKLISLSYLNIN